MKKITISVRVHIAVEDIESLLDSASRACSYWAVGVEKLAYESGVKAIMSGKGHCSIKLLDDDLNGKDRGFILNLDRVKRGLTCMAKKEPKHFADILDENADDDTADVFMQCALLNEVIYG